MSDLDVPAYLDAIAASTDRVLSAALRRSWQ